jgi:hypothetical protein
MLCPKRENSLNLLATLTASIATHLQQTPKSNTGQTQERGDESATAYAAIIKALIITPPQEPTVVFVTLSTVWSITLAITTMCTTMPPPPPSAQGVPRTRKLASHSHLWPVCFVLLGCAGHDAHHHNIFSLNQQRQPAADIFIVRLGLISSGFRYKKVPLDHQLILCYSCPQALPLSCFSPPPLNTPLLPQLPP